MEPEVEFEALKVTAAEYDLVVIGSGPSRQKRAIAAAKSRKRVAVIGDSVPTATTRRSNFAGQRSTLNRWRPIGHTRRQCRCEQECHHQTSHDRGLRQSLFNERTKSVLPGATTPADSRARLKHCVDLFSGSASCCWQT